MVTFKQVKIGFFHFQIIIAKNNINYQSNKLKKGDNIL